MEYSKKSARNDRRSATEGLGRSNQQTSEREHNMKFTALYMK